MWFDRGVRRSVPVGRRPSVRRRKAIPRRHTAWPFLLGGTVIGLAIFIATVPEIGIPFTFFFLGYLFFRRRRRRGPDGPDRPATEPEE